jgi:hypothetical protein
VWAVSTKYPPSVASQASPHATDLPDLTGGALPDFDDGPTQLGSSWFPAAASVKTATPVPTSARSVRSVRPSDGRLSAPKIRRDESSRPTSSRPAPPLRASQASPPFRSPSNQEEVSSFPGATATVPLSAAKGVAAGLAITGLLGVGAIAYKAALGHGAMGAASMAAPVAAAWTLNGDVEPSRQASIQARGAGKVDELDVAVGTFVHEGDVLAKISGAAASTVRAPFDGVITAVYTTKGAEIAAGSSLPVADLADTSRVRVRLPLASGDESKVRAGDAVTVWSEAAPTHTLRATVARVIPSLNSRVASAEVDLDHPGLTPLDRVHAQLR